MNLPNIRSVVLDAVMIPRASFPWVYSWITWPSRTAEGDAFSLKMIWYYKFIYSNDPIPDTCIWWQICAFHFFVIVWLFTNFMTCPSSIVSGFHGSFATGVACQQGTHTIPDTWFGPRLWNLLVLQLLKPDSSNLPCLYATFHLEYPLVLSRFCLLRGN